MANEALDKELRESIAYFEQILDVLPGERTALEFLCVACSQLGDQEKFLKYALALADAIVKENSSEGAEDLLQKLEPLDDPRAKEAVLKLQVLVAPKPELAERPKDERLTTATVKAAVKSEIELLNRLVAEGVLVKDQVKLAYEQLESLPTEGNEFLVSALLILEKESLPGAADAVAAVADAAVAPPVPLMAFELVPGDIRKLPVSFIKVRGAVPFAKLGDEWAVALLNPLDERLKSEISDELGAKCHFFTAPPAMIEAVLDRILEGEGEEVKGEEVKGEGDKVKGEGEGEKVKGEEVKGEEVKGEGEPSTPSPSTLHPSPSTLHPSPSEPAQARPKLHVLRSAKK